MKLPKLATPRACYFWGAALLLVAVLLAVFGPLAQGILWLLGLAALVYGAALQFAPEELAGVKDAVKAAASAAKKPDPGP